LLLIAAAAAAAKRYLLLRLIRLALDANYGSVNLNLISATEQVEQINQEQALINSPLLAAPT